MQQALLLPQLSLRTDQKAEQIETFGGQRNRLSIPRQQMLIRVEVKGSEAVSAVRLIAQRLPLYTTC
jgi:hypothetical protein